MSIALLRAHGIKVLALFFLVVGTRPEAIKLAPVALALKAKRHEVILCATGQHTDLVTEALSWFELVPTIMLGPHPPDLNDRAGSILSALGGTMRRMDPDLVIVQGDTTSALAGALAAYHCRIRLAHVEAGLRTGNLSCPWPEEGNRKLIAALADIHFAPTEAAAEALRREGVSGRVCISGNTGLDSLRIIGPGPSPIALGGRKLVLVTCHRRESMAHGMQQVASALGVLAKRPDVLIALPTHPNPVVRQAFAELANVRLLDPLSYPDFTRLLAASYLVLTDSGGVQEEAQALRIPTLVLRDATERSEGLSAGTARLIGTSSYRIIEEARRLLDQPQYRAEMARGGKSSDDGRAADRIVGVLGEAVLRRGSDAPKSKAEPKSRSDRIREEQPRHRRRPSM